MGISALRAETLTPLLQRAQALITATMGRDGLTVPGWRRDDQPGEDEPGDDEPGEDEAGVDG